tara:strand:+ start:60 stop:362 length:303 start_codon:yes stop_codon:yes gene_type:complete
MNIIDVYQPIYDDIISDGISDSDDSRDSDVVSRDSDVVVKYKVLKEDSSDVLSIPPELFSYTYSAGLKPHLIQEIYNYSDFSGHIAFYLLKVPDYSYRTI